MSAYVIVDVDIIVDEPARYEEYKKLAFATVVQYGGRFVVRGGKAENLEGDWDPKRIVVLEFPSYERAKEWWGSPEYAPAKALRQELSKAKMIVVEGP
jgi:uncharacterized protein (DUF1330 family)